MRGFYVPPHEPSSPGTLLVGVLSQYPVKVKGLRVPLGSWGSARVYRHQVIAFLLSGHYLDSGCMLWVVALPLIGLCSTHICRLGVFLPLGSWGFISMCCHRVIALPLFGCC